MNINEKDILADRLGQLCSDAAGFNKSVWALIAEIEEIVDELRHEVAEEIKQFEISQLTLNELQGRINYESGKGV